MNNISSALLFGLSLYRSFLFVLHFRAVSLSSFRPLTLSPSVLSVTNSLSVCYWCVERRDSMETILIKIKDFDDKFLRIVHIFAGYIFSVRWVCIVFVTHALVNSNSFPNEQQCVDDWQWAISKMDICDEEKDTRKSRKCNIIDSWEMCKGATNNGRTIAKP